MPRNEESATFVERAMQGHLRGAAVLSEWADTCERTGRHQDAEQAREGVDANLDRYNQLKNLRS